MSLSEIRYDQLQSFVHELAKEVSIETPHNLIVCLRVMLVGKRGRSALKREFLRLDPTRGIEMPAMDQNQVVPPTRTLLPELTRSSGKEAATGDVYRKENRIWQQFGSKT